MGRPEGGPGRAGRLAALPVPPRPRPDRERRRPCTDPFAEVYQLDNEAARELADKTVHDIMHLGWVPTDDGGYELRMAALVRPSGQFGRLYMAVIGTSSSARP
nr:DUF2867 domain-containing protein [Streptomyces inhibens]